MRNRPTGIAACRVGALAVRVVGPGEAVGVAVLLVGVVLAALSVTGQVHRIGELRLAAPPRIQGRGPTQPTYFIKWPTQTRLKTCSRGSYPGPKN